MNQYAFLVVISKYDARTKAKEWVWQGIFANNPTKAMLKAAIEQTANLNREVWDLMHFIDTEHHLEENGFHDIRCAGQVIGTVQRHALRFIP